MNTYELQHLWVTCWTCCNVSLFPLKPLKANGAEEENSVEQQKTEAESTVQPPVVDMNTQDLSRESDKWTKIKVKAIFPV